MDYSTKKIPESLLNEIKSALQSVKFGSVEIYVQDKTVTQITVRSIKKTSIQTSDEVSLKETVAFKHRIAPNKN